MDKLFFILLGIWAVLFGIAHLTNIAIAFSEPAAAIAALALGVICIVRAAR